MEGHLSDDAENRYSTIEVVIGDRHTTGRYTIVVQDGEVEKFLGYYKKDRSNRLEFLSKSILWHIQRVIHDVNNLSGEDLISEECQGLYDSELT
jgi:hypothetical protein|tara:strand:- start:40577 stop:40858 length:282 start_codon:yes stop_codon:yes gene_type:complete